MAMEEKQIRSLILESIPDAEVIIEDLRGDGDHYSCHIISNIFTAKSRVEQHKIVYSALKGRMGNELHALAIKTSTPK
tara:strand:+ start:87 stop:320 length:234 start_codon:yes stop_codon:yes gene_type:complete